MMQALRRLRRKIGQALNRVRGRGGPKVRPNLFEVRADGLPVGQTFQNVVVVPGIVNPHNLGLVNGGPIWPDFENQTWVRQIRGIKPVDFRPPDPAHVGTTLSGPCVWGGCLFVQFGHLCGENMTRILWSLDRWPDATFLFAVSHEADPDNMPGYFWTLVDWLGLPRGQVRFIREPTCVDTLHVMPQAETLFGRKPIPSFLDLLDARVAQNGLQPVASDCLYVTRVGMLAAGSGGNAGEAYLQDCLVKAGVEVLDPAAVPFQEQMNRYAGAKTLIFAEGSAVHGRQMLGRIDQNILVLNRRPKNNFGRRSLVVRAGRLVYAKTTKQFAVMHYEDSHSKRHEGLSFYHLPELFRGLAEFGLDLEPMWNAADYGAARDADVALWLQRLDPLPRGIRLDATMDVIKKAFQAAGVMHLWPRLDNR